MNVRTKTGSLTAWRRPIFLYYRGGADAGKIVPFVPWASADLPGGPPLLQDERQGREIDAGQRPAALAGEQAKHQAEPAGYAEDKACAQGSRDQPERHLIVEQALWDDGHRQEQPGRRFAPLPEGKQQGGTPPGKQRREVGVLREGREPGGGPGRPDREAEQQGDGAEQQVAPRAVCQQHRQT